MITVIKNALVALKHKIYSHPYIFYLVIGTIILVLNSVLSFDPEQRDNRGRTALYLAAEQGDVAQVTSLLKKTQHPDQRDDCKWTPLMRAAQNGHLEVSTRLLNAGADVNAIDKGGFSVLMVAASEHNPEILSLLIKQGAALNVQDSASGWSALPP